MDRPSDATGLVDTGKLVTMLGQSDAASVMDAVEQISQLKLGTVDENLLIEDLVACGYIQSADLVRNFGSPTALDPTNDPTVNQIFSAGDITGDSKYRKTASVMKLVMNGFAGAGTIEFGGYRLPRLHARHRRAPRRRSRRVHRCRARVRSAAQPAGDDLRVHRWRGVEQRSQRRHGRRRRQGHLAERQLVDSRRLHARLQPADPGRPVRR